MIMLIILTAVYDRVTGVEQGCVVAELAPNHVQIGVTPILVVRMDML